MYIFKPFFYMYENTQTYIKNEEVLKTEKETSYDSEIN